MDTFEEIARDSLEGLGEQALDRVKRVSPILRMLKDNRTDHAFALSFSTDSIGREGVLYVENSAALPAAYAEYAVREGVQPGVVLTGDAGAFALGATMEEAACVRQAFLSGGSVPACSARAGDKPLSGKVVIVTGGAQGFGAGIADYLAGQGATVALTDINLPLARQTARAIRQKHGPFAAVALAMDVTREDSVERAIGQVVALMGGVDVLLCNAGVLRAGETETLSLDDFLYVTRVNYVGYFLCVKKIIPVMRLQHSVNSGYWMDIIQTNSKSGLTGSNKNCSYAGSKFGGIGLTQSFALELAGIGIKVNAICPGNYLSGPLWSDEREGLFAQYLRAGKVEGARTVQDLVRYYNGKVPMRRGCEPEDVAKAIVYIIGQEYETGQAMPVTGGQIMLG